ncbi:hypothetical protein ACOZDF_25740 [Streptomyces griseoincarnatus]|uniref:hypothetical protein n=1 Tax=Streptomyces sp. RK31 TaxID=2824892 RepID=UPI000E0AB161|nr:hypothetical protein [Streptomyces sp. RK31]AXI87291.1 hypothetical protein SAM9427_16625 [Streptomyces sp. ETH9427]MBQ0971606.1 hypothetical protein [Streptomyces sp. RK31]
MTRAPARARTFVASALSVTVLLITAACVAYEREVPRALPQGVPEPPAATTPSPSATASPSAVTGRSTPVLNDEQLEAALITEADLGPPWAAAQAPALWRDGTLKATADDGDCRRLLEVLYTEEPFGVPAGPRASVTLDDTAEGTQLREQIGAHGPEDVERALEWLRTLPERCERFRAKTARSGAQDVEVTELPLPDTAGDARAALRVTLTGGGPDGAPARLTVDLAAIRVGEDAIVLTNGGFGEVRAEVTQAMAQLGADRLAEVARQGRLRV